MYRGPEINKIYANVNIQNLRVEGFYYIELGTQQIIILARTRLRFSSYTMLTHHVNCRRI